MDVAAKQKLLLRKLKQKIKQLHAKEERGRAKMRAALNKANKVASGYKIRFERQMREMEHKLAHTEAACYAKIVFDLEKKLVKGIKEKLKALTAAARHAKRSITKRAPRKSAAKRSTTAGRRGQKKV